MGKGACFIKAVLHMVDRFKQRKVMCSHFRLISSDEVQTVFRLSPSLFSHAPYGARQLPPGGSQVDVVRIRPKFHKTITACRETPQSGPLGLPAPLSGALWTRSLAAPFGGSAAQAAKGVSLVALNCYHSTNHTPSVSPYGLPAPPPGSQVEVKEDHHADH